MQKLLFLKTIRDLKKNFLRYLALLLLVALSMFIVVGLVGSAEGVISSVNSRAFKNNLEDGEFSVFLPLKDNEIEEIKNKDIDIEPSFSCDYQFDKNSIVRIMKIRKNINLVEYNQGIAPISDNEIALERIFATAHNLKVNDKVKFSGNEFRVCAIVTSPDYDSCLKELSDSSADGNLFGTAFVNDETYEKLSKSSDKLNSEDYYYSYKLTNNATDKELKDYLNDLKISADDVDDEYFQELVQDKSADRNKLTDSTKDLEDGASSLNSAMKELSDGSADLEGGIETVGDGLASLNKSSPELCKNSDKEVS